MLKVLKATYRNGRFDLEEKLGSEWEGRTVEITIKSKELGETEEERKARMERFIERAKEYRIILPPDYKFDRDEIYDR